MMIPAIPELDDTERAAFALVLCGLRGDAVGVQAIIDTTGHDALLKALMQRLINAIGREALADGCPEDMLTGAVEFAIVTMLQGQTT